MIFSKSEKYQLLTDQLTPNLKSRDASASTNLLSILITQKPNSMKNRSKMPRGNEILSLLLFTAPGLNFGAPLGDKSGNI